MICNKIYENYFNAKSIPNKLVATSYIEIALSKSGMETMVTS